MLYRPTDIIHFGKYSSYTLADIYKFEPSYIEWSIEFVPDFMIEVSDFNHLPNPTPFINQVKEVKLGSRVIKNFPYVSDNKVMDGKEFIRNGGVIPEIDFAFSEKYIDILQQKSLGKYNTPNWKKLEGTKFF